MVFEQPTWWDGTLFYMFWILLVPFIAALVAGLGIGGLTKDAGKGFASFIIVGFIAFLVMIPYSNVIWHNQVEKASVQEKIITVEGWYPKTGIHANENGIMEIYNADQLMLTTKEGEQFVNEENFLFNKFATRELFHKLRVNGTYKIKYYGWREGYNTGFPNILSVVEVINETNTVPIRDQDYFGSKLVIGNNNLYPNNN